MHFVLHGFINRSRNANSIVPEGARGMGFVEPDICIRSSSSVVGSSAGPSRLSMQMLFPADLNGASQVHNGEEPARIFVNSEAGATIAENAPPDTSLCPFKIASTLNAFCKATMPPSKIQ
jgi:hypothetical protein